MRRAALLLLVLVAVPGFGVSRAAASSPAVVFEAPPGLQGPLAVTVPLSFVAPAHCTVSVGLSGYGSNPSGPNGMILSSVGGGISSSSGSVIPSVHAAGLDNRGSDTSSSWTIWRTFSGILSGSPSWTAITSHASAVPHPHFPYFPSAFHFEANCDGPFEVAQLSGSRAALDFDSSSMSGGTGAHASKTALVVAPSVNLQWGDVAEGVFPHSRVWFHYENREQWFPPAGYLGAYVGRLSLQTPDGPQTWTLANNLRTIDWSGPPGSYALTVNRAGGGSADDGRGFLAGFDDVASLADLA